MKIAVVQMNPTVGALDKNCKAILKHAHAALKKNADLAVFPELSLLGYPPKDLLLRDDFIAAQIEFIEKMASETPLPIIFGAAIRESADGSIYNAAIMCSEGTWQIVGKKVLLPNYNVFDEKRYFSSPPEQKCGLTHFKGKKLLISICEDAWGTLSLPHQPSYSIDPIKDALLSVGSVDVIINISASPFTISKPKRREKIFTHLAKTYHTPVIMAGQVGANDQLLFDGHSMIINSEGTIISKARNCTEDCIVFDSEHPVAFSTISPVDNDELLVECLVMGIKDYVEKCNAPGIIIGISGGIDSAVCAALAVRAIGKDRVKGVFLPSQFTSARSQDEAGALAKNLGIELTTVAIEDSVELLRKRLKPVCGDKNEEIVDQNLQARIRGVMVMAISNASGYFMMATSNKSEIAVGYSTIYGDMCGAFSPIGDLYKTQIIKLAHTLNKQGVIIPPSTIERPPTAELKSNQFDSDSLPDYQELDAILVNFIDHDKSAADTARITRAPRELVDKVINLVALAEYKRRQGPFCLMVSDKVFGDARRMPIAKQVPRLTLPPQTSCTS